MINGHISLENARCKLVEAEERRVVDGLPTDEMVRTKILHVWDPASGFEVKMLFRDGEFEAFLKCLRGED